METCMRIFIMILGAFSTFYGLAYSYDRPVIGKTIYIHTIAGIEIPEGIVKVFCVITGIMAVLIGIFS